MVTQIKSEWSVFSIPADRLARREEIHYETNPAWQFRIFACLWAIASLFHMAHSSVFDSQLNFALLTLAALYVIARPRAGNFTVFIILQVFDALYRMPFTTNHWIFTAFVNITILQALIFLIVTRKTFKLREDVLLQTFAPVVRIELIVLYFFAVFHKLNSGFFTPASSCGFDLLKAQQLDVLIPFTRNFYQAIPFITITIELAVPVLLCIRQTRHTGILVGILFHGVLAFSSYNPFFDFSSMLFAVYFLFAAPHGITSLHQFMMKVKTKAKEVFVGYSLPKLIVITVAFVTVIGVMFILNQKLNSFRTVHLFFWGIFCAAILFLFSRHWLFIRNVSMKIFSLPHLVFIAVPLLVFLNGMSPYLGLKTENSYAMFSNLRTEGGVSNHYLMPAGLQIFSYQKDVVEIASSSDAGLQELSTEGKALVLFEFRNLLQSRKPDRVEYLLNGKKKIYERNNAATHAGVTANSPVLAKLMRFRAFSKNEPQPCSH